MDRSNVVHKQVMSGQTIIESPILPLGKKWQINVFGGLDVDNKGTIYVLQHNFGGTWQTIRALSVFGNTIEFSIRKEFLGDGTSKLRVVIINNSTVSKEICFWYDIVEL